MAGIQSLANPSLNHVPPCRISYVQLTGSFAADNTANMVFGGAGDVELVNNTFNDCRWTFNGAAADTVNFMTVLYAGAPPNSLKRH